MTIREYSDAEDRTAVMDLWTRVFGPTTGHNEPSFAIDQKLKVGDRLFFVAVVAEVVGTVMAGYDGHRGWIYSLAVSPEKRRVGIGAALMRHAESALVATGCAKVNLQVVATNADVVRFYEKCGYEVEPRISMSKKLNQPNKPVQINAGDASRNATEVAANSGLSRRADRVRMGRK